MNCPPVVQRGIRSLTEEVRPQTLLTIAEDLHTCLNVLKETPVDLIITGVHLSNQSNSEVIEILRRLDDNVPILVFADSYRPADFMLSCLHKGINGYLSLDAKQQDFRAAFDKIEEGKKYFTPTIQEFLLNFLIDGKGRRASPACKLSPRQLDVADLLVKGNSSTKIGAILNLRVTSISTIKRQIFKKMKISNLIELAELMKK